MGLARMKPGETAKAFPAEQVPYQELLVRYKGNFDFTYIYREVKRWFEQRRFRFYDTRLKDTGVRLKNDWTAERNLDEFVKEEYDIKVQMWDLTQNEIMVNGQPRKIFNGMVQFWIRGSITVDRSGFFSGKGKFVQLLGNIMMNARWREIEMKYVDGMEYRTLDIQILIKQCLNMSTKENAPW